MATSPFFIFFVRLGPRAKVKEMACGGVLLHSFGICKGKFRLQLQLNLAINMINGKKCFNYVLEWLNLSAITFELKLIKQIQVQVQ